MFKKILGILGFLLLTGCNIGQNRHVEQVQILVVSCESKREIRRTVKRIINRGEDGYTFGNHQNPNKNFQIRMIIHPTKSDLQHSARKYVSVDTNNVVAFSVLDATNNICTIHILDPAKSYRPEYIGHELTHCVYGQWHTDNKSFS